MTTKKRLAAYGMAATAAIGGGIGGLAIGLGLTGEQASIGTVDTELAAASTDAAMPVHFGGPGKGGPDGGVKIDRLGIAATALGIATPEELRTTLEAGKSLAQIATDRNVDIQKVIDALVAAQNASIDQAVKDGKITQAQADERKAKVAEHVKAEVERVGHARAAGGRGKGGPHGGVKIDHLSIAATALGIATPEELRTTLEAGKSLAQIATDRNVDIQKVIDALVAAQNTAIDQAVKDGKITQAQADERKAKVAEHVKAEVERVGHARAAGGPGKGGPGGPGMGGRGHGGRGMGGGFGGQVKPAADTSATPASVVVG